ncbi:MAG: hypothetical protein JWM11_4676 [Planctomycetaceae bacterium]|nr:hypothetical protein [Planctomycetaceae bacterium]
MREICQQTKTVLLQIPSQSFGDGFKMLPVGNSIETYAQPIIVPVQSKCPQWIAVVELPVPEKQTCFPKPLSNEFAQPSQFISAYANANRGTGFEISEAAVSSTIDDNSRNRD